MDKYIPRKLEDISDKEKIEAFDSLYKNGMEFVDYMNSEEFHEDNDYSHYLYEDLMTAIFGQSFFDYYNNKLR